MRIRTRYIRALSSAIGELEILHALALALHAISTVIRIGSQSYIHTHCRDSGYH